MKPWTFLGISYEPENQYWSAVHPRIADPSRWHQCRLETIERFGERQADGRKLARCMWRNSWGVRCHRASGEHYWTFSRWGWPQRHAVVIECDHIKPFHGYPDSAWDPNNFQLLCREHNSVKSDGPPRDFRPGNYSWWRTTGAPLFWASWRAALGAGPKRSTRNRRTVPRRQNADLPSRDRGHGRGLGRNLLRWLW